MIALAAWYYAPVNIERTMEFILESQANTEVRLTGITKLMKQGMRMLVKTDTQLAELATAQKRTEGRVAELAVGMRELSGEMKELSVEMKELAKAQKELAHAQKTTERTLQAFIKGQRNGRNGR